MKKKYKIFIADKYLCSIAVLQSAIEYQTGLIVDQNKLASLFKVNVPKSYNGPLININRTNNSKSWGIKFDEKKLNRVLKKLSIKLKITYMSIFTIIDEWELLGEIERNLEENRSVFCGINYTYLNDSRKMREYGHILLITDILDHNFVVLDPGPDKYGFKKYHAYDLYCSIKIANAGIWIVEKC